ncbi:amino acid synthesis family protein [Roseovarius faecimaris]|nr:amino acid synthesis family protein [Roseovarius faecimaris]
MTLSIADAPRADELILCMALSDGTRIHPRVGSRPSKT